MERLKRELLYGSLPTERTWRDGVLAYIRLFQAVALIGLVALLPALWVTARAYPQVWPYVWLLLGVLALSTVFALGQRLQTRRFDGHDILLLRNYLACIQFAERVREELEYARELQHAAQDAKPRNDEEEISRENSIAALEKLGQETLELLHFAEKLVEESRIALEERHGSIEAIFGAEPVLDEDMKAGIVQSVDLQMRLYVAHAVIRLGRLGA